MFGDQTPSNIVWWPNMLLNWVAKRLKHVWSNTDQTMDTSRWTSVVSMRAPNMFNTGCPNERNIAHQTLEQKKYLKLFDRIFDGLQILSNTTKHDQTRSNSTKQGGQTVKCLVTRQCLMVFGRQTFPVWTGLNSFVFSWDMSVLKSEAWQGCRELRAAADEFYRLKFHTKIWSFQGQKSHLGLLTRRLTLSTLIPLSAKNVDIRKRCPQSGDSLKRNSILLKATAKTEVCEYQFFWAVSGGWRKRCGNGVVDMKCLNSFRKCIISRMY